MYKGIKTAYYYLYYKLYKFWDYVSFPKLWSGFKAVITLIALEIWTALSALIYYNIFIDRAYNFEKQHFILIGLSIAALNFFVFNNEKNKTKYFEKFEKLPKRKNNIGTLIVLMLITILLINLVFSINQLK